MPVCSHALWVVQAVVAGIVVAVVQKKNWIVV